jgi:hypothetical protein
MQNRWNLLALLILTAMPASGQTSKPNYLPKADHVCKARLAEGTDYERWDRVLVSESKGQRVYVEVRAYYKPGSGEFFWRSSALSENSYAVELRNNANQAVASCEESYHNLLFLQDGEWADFWAFNSRIEVFHCNLRFGTLKEAWSHVAEHWQDGNFAGGPSAKWVAEILLYKQLGNEFFRPKRLEFDARPFVYNSLDSVKKVGQNWELEIKGADEPNRATVLLDANFKLLAVTKNTAPR